MADPNSYGFGYDPFGTGIPQLLPKFDGSQNMLTQPGVGVPVGFGTGAGLAGGIVGTAVGNPLVNSALDAAKLPGDAYLGNVDLSSPAGFARAHNMAGMLMGGGMPMAEAGAAGVFGGRLARGADLSALKTAEEMTTAGHDRGTIYQQTGWFQGPDKRWRFEITDDQSSVNPNAVNSLVNRQEFAGTAGGFLAHPDLYKQYPDLAQLDTVAFYNPMGPGNSGGYHQNYISLNNNYVNGQSGAHGVMLHELQHAIQNAEGFSPGANYELVGREAYLRSLGEIEARNVQRRMNMTPEERLHTPPWITAEPN